MEVYETREISDLLADCCYKKKPSRDYDKNQYGRKKPDYKPYVVRRR